MCPYTWRFFLVVFARTVRANTKEVSTGEGRPDTQSSRGLGATRALWSAWCVRSKVFPAKPFEFRPRVHVQFRLVFADAYPYAHRMARRHSVVSLERDGWSILPGRFGGAAHHVLRVRCVSRACRPCFVSGSLRDLEHDIFRQVGKTGPSARQANNEKPCSVSAHGAYLHVYLGLQGMGR